MAEPNSIIKFQGLTFKCTNWSRGLCYQNYAFDSNFSNYMPKLTKRGAISKVQPRESKPIAYWKAQCAFRGLSTKGLKKDELQEALRGKESLKMVEELSEFENKTQKAWAVYNENMEKIEDAEWEKENERLNAEAVDTLRKRFLDDKTEENQRVLVVKMRDMQWRLKRAAEILGLATVHVDGIIDWDDKNCDTSMWMIIGRKIEEVLEKKRQIEDGFKRAEEEKERKKMEALESEQNRIKGFHRELVKFSEKNGGAWDITGKWKIDCPCIKNGWFSSADVGMMLEIFVSPTDSTDKEMWAKFDFGLIKGIFRFLRQGGPVIKAGAGKEAENTSMKIATKRKREMDDYGDDDSEDEDDEIPDPAFKIPNGSHPSSAKPTWQYRWRGRECDPEIDAGGEIQVGEDEHVYKITFSGIAGETLNGTIGSTYFRQTSFTGVKIGKGSAPNRDVGKEWGRLSERASDLENRKW